MTIYLPANASLWIDLVPVFAVNILIIVGWCFVTASLIVDAYEWWT